MSISQKVDLVVTESNLRQLSELKLYGAKMANKPDQPTSLRSAAVLKRSASTAF